MKNIAKTKEIAIDAAKAFLANQLSIEDGDLLTVLKINQTSIHCGCGETQAVEIILDEVHNFESKICGYCEQCGSDYIGEIV